MTTEEELRQALGRLETYVASPDLFARVVGTLEEDARHRARVRHTVTGALAGVAALVGWFAVTGSIDGSRVVLPGWSLETATTSILVMIVLSLAPALRRFGEAYLAGTLGRDSTGRFASLLDVAYYLVCAGYILLTASWLPDVVATPVGPEQLLRASWRIGGLLGVLGGLHAVTILALPLVGLLLRSVRWRSTPNAEPDPRARAADRVAVAAAVVLCASLVGAVGIAVVFLVVVGISP